MKKLKCPNDKRDDYYHDALYIYHQLDSERKKTVNDVTGYICNTAKWKYLASLKHEEFVVLTGRIYMHVPFDENADNDEYLLFLKHFRRMNKECQEILDLYISGLSHEDISCKLGYKNVVTVRKMKFKCKERLIEMVKSDPIYKEINGGQD